MCKNVQIITISDYSWQQNWIVIVNVTDFKIAIFEFRQASFQTIANPMCHLRLHLTFSRAGSVSPLRLPHPWQRHWMWNRKIYRKYRKCSKILSLQKNPENLNRQDSNNKLTISRSFLAASISSRGLPLGRCFLSCTLLWCSLILSISCLSLWVLQIWKLNWKIEIEKYVILYM